MTTIVLDPIEVPRTVQPAVLPLPSPPDEWVPPSLTDTTGVHRIQVGVSTLWPYEWLGEIVHARVRDGREQNLDGSESCTIDIPCDDPSAQALLMDDLEEWLGVTTGRFDLIDRRFHTIEDGKVTGIYVCRDPVTITDGVATLNLKGGTRLFEDRTLGRGQSNDLLMGWGHFPGDGDIIAESPWQKTDGLTVTEGVGARQGRCAVITGDPAEDYLFLRYYKEVTEETTFHNLIRSSAFIKVPSQADPGQSLMELEVLNIVGGIGEPYFPERGAGNEGAAVVEEDTPTSSDPFTADWTHDPITAKANLPLGPYLVRIEIRIYPTQSGWTLIDEVELFQDDNLTTGNEPSDLVQHLRILVEDGQNEAKGKTSWGMGTRVGASCGIEEVGTWWRSDDIPLPDAIDGICSRAGGPDPVWVDLNWRAVCAFRRGQVRDDFVLGMDQVVRWEGHTVDPGSMVSQVRATTELGADSWRHNSVKTNTSQTHGHLIELVTRAPNGMGLRQVDQWTDGFLRERSQAQETVTVWVPLAFGWTVNVGDTFRAVLFDKHRGGARFDRQVRVTSRSFHDSARLVMLRLGTDDLGLGRPAKNLDWTRAMGRDRHAIGSGLVNTAGRVSRARTATPKRYRPPTSDPLEESTTSTSSGVQSSGSIDIPAGDGRWLVKGTVAVEGSMTGRAYVRVVGGGGGEADSNTSPIDTGTFGGGIVASASFEVRGPATVAATSNLVLDPSPTILDHTTTITATRIT